MKKLYWRPQRLSVRMLLLIAVVAAASLTAVETFRVRQEQPFFREKRAAARLALQAFRAIKEDRLKRRIKIDPETDPAETGLIGALISPVTTNTGHLSAKQTSINPNFAAVVVDMLLRAEIKQGDVVALGLSGSFPALNIAALAAVQTLKLHPIIISSAGASQWGANHPRFMWPEMEAVLAKRGIFRHRSIAISLGGIDDRALGLSAKGRRLIETAVQRSDRPLMQTEGYDDSLAQRMELYREQAGDAEVTAYINIGGGTASVGTRVGRNLFRPGLNRRLPRGPQIDSVMTRFATRGIPILHLSKISRLAQRYGLQQQPNSIPAVGEGKMFVRAVYNPWLAAGSLALLVMLLVAFLRLDWGYRLFAAKSGEAAPSRPEPMV